MRQHSRKSLFYISCRDVAAATVVLSRALIREMDSEIAINKALKGRFLETNDALALPVTQPGKQVGFAPEVLKAAIYFIHAGVV